MTRPCAKLTKPAVKTTVPPAETLTVPLFVPDGRMSVPPLTRIVPVLVRLMLVANVAVPEPALLRVPAFVKDDGPNSLVLKDALPRLITPVD